MFSKQVRRENLPPVFKHRRAGVLLHPTSLPGESELGELGGDAFRFIEWMQQAGLTVWQVLPLGPTQADLSPYMSPSVHAGNIRLISLDVLRDWGWLERDFDPGMDDQFRRHRLLQEARAGFEKRAGKRERAEFERFCERHRYWLEDFAVYQALRQVQLGKPWTHWPPALRDREPQAMARVRRQYASYIQQARFEQFVFFRQWLALKAYANERGIFLFGDMPIFVAHDSAEVWARPDYFDLTESGEPRTVAGVPPDYFSDTGQRWGNPHYRWERMAEDGYQWWKRRLQTGFEMFDLVRIDHFRGFSACWEIDANEETAVIGRWVPGPGDALFEALREAFPRLPLVAEDLGIITPEVEALRDRFGFPGMKILQFAFDGSPDNPYLPAHHPVNSVVYTGTHDNDTSCGWFASLNDDARRHVSALLSEWSREPMPWALIETALASPAQLAMVPMQDFLALGSEARMNVPAQTEGNWRWRFCWQQLHAGLSERIDGLVRAHGRYRAAED